MGTVGAAIEMATQRGRATACDGAEHAVVLRGQPSPVRLDEAIPVCSNDIGHLKGWPGHRLCSRRDRRAVSGPETDSVSNGFATACRCRRERCR